jgi:phosphatidylserine/phosphatidylglycerophosphate/cardiolipin synthase-like enzyme
MTMNRYGRRTHRFGRIVLIVLAGVIAIWLVGHLLLDVQFPDPLVTSTDAGRPDDEDRSMREIFESLPAEGATVSQVTLLDDNVMAWVERWRLLANARKRLDISYFILEQDVFGIAFLGHLVHKAGQGLTVRVLLDAIGTTMSRDVQGNDYLDTVVQTANVTVKLYRPLRYRFQDAFLTLNPAAIVASDHDKILLADGVHGLIGGRNIATEYFADLNFDPKAFRDADAVLTGREAGAVLEAVFESQYDGGEAHAVTRETVDLLDSTSDLLLAYQAMDYWLRGEPIPEAVSARIRDRRLPWIDELQARPMLHGALARPAPESVQAPVRFLDSRTRLIRTDDPITVSLGRLVRGAKKSIFVANPYLVLSEQAVSVLEDAARRGVEITVLTNSPVSSDNPLSQAFFLEQWPKLLARVPTLRLFVAGDRHNLHGKFAVIDDQLGLLGTYNLDPLSMALNSELVAAVWSARFAEKLLETGRQLIAAGPPTAYEYRIARDDEGRPSRDEEGRIIVAFGPNDHLERDDWTAVRRYRWLVRGLAAVSGRSFF